MEMLREIAYVVLAVETLVVVALALGVVIAYTRIKRLKLHILLISISYFMVVLFTAEGVYTGRIVPLWRIGFLIVAYALGIAAIALLTRRVPPPEPPGGAGQATVA